MIGRRTMASLLACTLVLLAAAPAASAKPGYHVFPGFRSLGFDLQGSHGYRIEIGKESDYVIAFVTKGDSVVSYTTRSLEPKGNGIEARFPGIGRVSVAFRPQGPPRKSSPYPFPGCRGGAIVKQPGHFVGRIRFRGERGYTSARTNRAKGAIETTLKEVCKHSPSDEGSEPAADRTELYAHSRSGNRAVGFDAYVLGDPFYLTSFGASVVELRRGMTIFRTTGATGERGDLAIGDTRPYPLSATVTPPGPFSGSAEYERMPDGSRAWTGSLAVSFPGLGRVALTGSGFSARLCHLSGCSEGYIDGHDLPWSASGHERLRDS
jgi:hypothetical protein